MKIVGIVPARMGAGRFPGKPLRATIKGRPLIEHCVRRAALYDGFDGLFLATCDADIAAWGRDNDIPVIMTADTHTRALDRVAEAAGACGLDLAPDDVVLNVQADEPMLGPDMIEAVIAPFRDHPAVRGTMLVMPIGDAESFHNPDIVKVVHDLSGRVLYTSRSPIPYAKAFSPDLGAKRVGGIFGFRWEALQWFTATPESPLEQKEACDSNRTLDHGFHQVVAEVPARPYQSVDSPSDVALVEAVIEADPYWGRY